MHNKNIISVVGLLIIVFMAFSSSGAQILYNQPGWADIKFHYNTWTLKNDSLGTKEEIDQLAIPVTAFIPIRDNFEARLFIVNASSNLTYNNNEYKLSGMGDLRLQFCQSLLEDQFVVSAGFNLPTGKKELDTLDGRNIIDYLSQDFLTFPVRRYGEGFGFHLMAGAARKIGRFRTGLSAMYNYVGEYTPYVTGEKYDPGDQISFSANANAIFDRIVYAADFVFTTYGTDLMDNADIYRQGKQFNALLSATFNDDPYSTQIGLRLITRGRNTRYLFNTGAVESQLKKYGNEFGAYARIVYTTGFNWNFMAHLESRKITASEEGLDKASIFNFGLDISKEFSKHFVLGVGGKYYTGSTHDDFLNIRGFQFTGGITAAF